MSNFEKFKENLLNKEQFYSLLTGKKLIAKNMNVVLRLGTNLEGKRKIITICF